MIFWISKVIKKVENHYNSQMNIYAGTYNGEVYMITGDPTNIQLKRKNQVSQTSIRAVYLPPESQQLLTGGFDGQLIAVNKHTLQSTKQTKEPKGIINCLQRVNDHVVAMGHENGLIRFWDWKSWSLKKQLREHKKPVRGFCIDPNQIMFFSAANNGLILWNTTKYEKVFHYKFDYEIDHVLVDQTLQNILFINSKQVHQIKAQNNEEVALFKIKTAEMIQSAIMFQQYLIIGGDKGSVWIYALGQYEHKISFQAHQLRVKSMKVFSMDGMDFLVTASSSGQISVWDVLEFLKEVDNIGQDYTLDGIQPLSSINLGKRVLCMQVALITAPPTVQKQVALQQKNQLTQQKFSKKDAKNKKKNRQEKKLPLQKYQIEVGGQKEQNTTHNNKDDLKQKKIEKMKKKLLMMKKLKKMKLKQKRQNQQGKQQP